MYFIALLLSSPTCPLEGVDVKGNRIGGVSCHAGSAGQLTDGAERFGEVCLLWGSNTKTDKHCLLQGM